MRKLHAADVGALVHCGFGFGVVLINPVLQELAWDPPRFMGTAFQNAWINPIVWDAIVGWIGLDQFDEGNPVGQAIHRSLRRTLRLASGVLRSSRQPGPGNGPAPRFR